MSDEPMPLLVSDFGPMTGEQGEEACGFVRLITFCGEDGNIGDDQSALPTTRHHL